MSLLFYYMNNTYNEWLAITFVMMCPRPRATEEEGRPALVQEDLDSEVQKHVTKNFWFWTNVEHLLWQGSLKPVSAMQASPPLTAPQAHAGDRGGIAEACH